MDIKNEVFKVQKLIKAKDYDEAENKLNNLLDTNVNKTMIYMSITNLRIKKKDFKGAIYYSKKVLELDKNFVDAYINLALSFQMLDNYEESSKYYNLAIDLNPNIPGLYVNYANLLRSNNDFEKACINYRKSIELNPDTLLAHYNLALTLENLGDYDNAYKHYQNALKIDPKLTICRIRIASCLCEMNRFDDAIGLCNRLLITNKKDHQIHSVLANIYFKRKEFNEAIVHIQNSFTIKPDSAEMLNLMGCIYKAQKIYDKSIIYFEKALEIKPDFYHAIYNLANLNDIKCCYKESISYYEQLIKIAPKKIKDIANATLMKNNRYICKWSENNCEFNNIKSLIDNDKFIHPHIMNCFFDDPKLILRNNTNFYNKEFKREDLISLKTTKKNKKIRIGYFSSNFYNHPVALLIVRIIELHNKDNFDIYAYSFSAKKDNYTTRIANNVKEYREMSDLDDIKCVNKAREDNLDIAIDLIGYTQDSRFNIFSSRVAPIQISYLGFPATTGSNCIDYIIGDEYLIPEEEQKFYSEKVINLPCCYQRFDETIVPSNNDTKRIHYGLPEKAFVFTCFNANYKISNESFDLWMRLLNQVEGSVLWLNKSNDLSVFNLQKEALKRNIDPTRIIFSNSVPIEEHINRHKLGDLFLDTFNYGAGVTASIALFSI